MDDVVKRDVFRNGVERPVQRNLVLPVDVAAPGRSLGSLGSRPYVYAYENVSAMKIEPAMFWSNP